ncbi:acyltransferase family protein [Motiliproteus sp.]|uniref:acyltransferase family protein n=1 Tax=Motiliproteus sp. TaxID=1898955 RepID=UPI003BACA963
MPNSFSLYLDIVRFSAAFLVFLYHSRNIYGYESLVFKLGHEAVVIFFVMSGFIIAYCFDTKEKKLSDFVINRASRIYSVAIPALCLTLLLDMSGAAINPAAYGDFFDLPWLRFLSSLLFTNEIWFISIQSFSNVPYWSINYEVWYYISFAAAFYFKRPLLLLTLIALLLGPKIVLLAPFWWIGVWIYNRNPLASLPTWLNTLLFGCSLIGFYLFVANGTSYAGWNLLESWLGKEYFRELAFSRYVISDYLLALIISLNFASARVLAANIEINENRVTHFIRTFANLTFALYLMHQPLLNFFDAVLAEYSLDPKLHHLLVSGITFILIVAIGSKIENTKYLYRRFFRSVHQRLNSLSGTIKAKPSRVEPN